MGGAAVVPHPFQRSRHGVRKRHLGDGAAFDALEVYNSMVFTGYRNRRARRFAATHGYPGVGASDAHYLPNVGRAYTEIEISGAGSVAEVTADDVVDAIRDGSTAISGRRTPIVRSTRQYSRAAVLKTAYVLTSMAPLVSARPASLAD
jgi:predicted metal-dependent phosphoesterase TrpH